MKDFFRGFGDELGKLAGLEQYKAQQQSRRQSSMGAATRKIPGLGSVPKAKTVALDQRIDKKVDPTGYAAREKAKADKSHRESVTAIKANPGLYGKQNKATMRDVGRADYAAREATKKTLDSKLTSKQIVDRYAMGLASKGQGGRRKKKPAAPAPYVPPKPMSYAYPHTRPHGQMTVHVPQARKSPQPKANPTSKSNWWVPRMGKLPAKPAVPQRRSSVSNATAGVPRVRKDI